MERVGHVWRVKAGMAEEYARRHRAIWPELEQVLRDAGVTTYTIYLWGELVFSHLECDDFERLVERFNGDPVAQRWEEEFSDVIEYPSMDPNGWPERLREVWSL
jgi:L-rhamnose mutarotase